MMSRSPHDSDAHLVIVEGDVPKRVRERYRTHGKPEEICKSEG
jgi:hypothetical protein